MSEPSGETESRWLALFGPADALRGFASTMVLSMTPERQAVFALAVEQRLSYPEIAQRLGLAEDAIKFHIRDGLRTMRQEAMGQLAVLGGPRHAGAPNFSRDDQLLSVDASL